MKFGTVAILGPGLIGGSLSLALAERGLAKRLMIYARSPRALDEIRLAQQLRRVRGQGDPGLLVGLVGEEGPGAGPGAARSGPPRTPRFG